MKNLFKMFGTNSRRLCAIALVAAIGFAMIACPTPTSGGNTGGTTGSSTGGGIVI